MKSEQLNSSNKKLFPYNVANPIWISVTEAAKIGGITTKTVRRAIKTKQVKFKILNNRYLIDLAPLIIFLHANKKLKNKLNFHGLGQYVDKWRQ